MVGIDELAEAALAGRALQLRSLAQDWLRENTIIAQAAPPASEDTTVRAVAAGLAELFAERRAEPAPAWVKEIAGAPRPIYLLKASKTMRRLRQLCESESPGPLRRRNLL